MSFFGTIARREFAMAVGIRVALFIVATIAFPFIVIVLAPLFGCSPGVASDGCGIAGLIVALAYKPLVFALFLGSLPSILARRLRDIGISPWWCLFVVLLIAADWSFLVVGGTSWTFGFSTGVLSIGRPDYLLCALGLLVALSLVPSRSGHIDLPQFGLPGVVSLALISVATVLAALRLFSHTAAFLAVLMAARPVFMLTASIQPYVLAILPLIVGATLWPRTDEVLASPTFVVPSRPIPAVRLGLAALSIAVVVMFVVDPQFRNPLFLTVGAVPLLLPTTGFYFGILLSAYLIIDRRGVPAVAVSCVMAVLLATWGYGHWQTAASYQADAAEIAALPKTTVTSIHPRVVLVDESNSTFQSLLLRRSDIDQVVKRKYNGVLVAYSLQSSGYEPDHTTLAALPRSYLDLRTERASAFSKPHKGYELDGPYELRLVDGDASSLAALWYQQRSRPPYWLPVLSFSGWLGNNNSYSEEKTKAVARFLNDALGEVPERPKPPSSKKKVVGAKLTGLFHKP